MRVIQASFPVRVTEFQKIWVDTFRTLGLENVRDPLTGHAMGEHTCQLVTSLEIDMSAVMQEWRI